MPTQFPKITLPQIIALAIAGLPSLLVLFSIDLDADQRLALDNLTNLGLGLFGADALIRVGRNIGQLTNTIRARNNTDAAGESL